MTAPRCRNHSLVFQLTDFSAHGDDISACAFFCSLITSNQHHHDKQHSVSGALQLPQIHQRKICHQKHPKQLFAPFRILSITAEEKLDRGQSVAHQEAISLVSPMLVPNLFTSRAQICEPRLYKHIPSSICEPRVSETTHPELNP